MSLRFHYTKFPRGVYFPVLDIAVADPHGGNPGFIYKVIVSIIQQNLGQKKTIEKAVDEKLDSAV